MHWKLIAAAGMAAAFLAGSVITILIQQWAREDVEKRQRTNCSTDRRLGEVQQPALRHDQPFLRLPWRDRGRR